MIQKPACMTKGCSGNCAFAYSCHEQRMGRTRLVIWPLVGVMALIIVGVLF